MKNLSLSFKLASYLGAIGWILLIGFPRAEFTDKTILSIIVILVSCVYAYLLLFAKEKKGEKFIKGSFFTLKGVINLFKNPRVVLIGWVHFIAFDLVVGVYIKNDALANDINFWLIIPSLILTMMVGPIGFLSYFILKMIVLQIG